jgi:hypothetical protein
MSEKVTKMLKTPPKALRNGPDSTSQSEITLSDTVEGERRSSINSIRGFAKG